MANLQPRSRDRYSIGEMARSSGTKVPTIRYYEQIGLVTSIERTEGNQRRYDERARERLRFVRHARELGFSLDAVRELLDLSDHPERPCEEADTIAREQLEAVKRRLESLTRLRRELERMIGCCDGGQIRDCRILQTVGDHGLCLHEQHGDEPSPLEPK